jgi:hypothetical protein
MEIRYQSDMPDYASILQRSIETLPEKTPEMRRAVYDRARAALARQLTSVEPPLGPESIELQHQHLEDAISAVEADFSPAAAGEGKEPEGVAANGEMPGETALPGDEEQEAAEAPAAEGEPSPAPGPDRFDLEETEPPAMAQIDAEPSNKRWEQPKASRAPAAVMLILFLLISGGVAVFTLTQWETVQALFGNFTGEQTIADVPAAGEPASSDDVPPGTADGELADVPKSEDRLLEGVAAPLDGAQETQQAAEAPDAMPVDGGANGLAGETATETAGETMEPAPAETGGTQMASETPAAETPAPETPAPETPAPEAATPETAVTEAPASEMLTGTETVDAVPQGLVGQRAIFEEQGAEGAPGKSVTGVVAWSQKDRENGPPAIVGVIDLPDRNAAVSLTITKNTDEALPASHLIEIEFRGAGGLVESPLERVPAIFLKKTAQGRGKRLTGEAVPVTENLYWVALSDQGDQVSRNLTLLREGAWLSMPMVFKNGRAALLTFEKGIPGDQVFEAVQAAWDKAGAGQ